MLKYILLYMLDWFATGFCQAKYIVLITIYKSIYFDMYNRVVQIELSINASEYGEKCLNLRYILAIIH